MTPNEIINEVRRLEQDSGLLRAPDSYIDETMLLFVNQTIKHTSILRPDLFAKLGEIVPQAGSVVQAMPQDSIRLIEVFHIKGGGSVNEVSHSMMERSSREWAATAPGTPINYMRHPRNPNRYFLYPAPVEGIVLIADYAQSPRSYALDEEIELIPAAYFTTLVHGTVAAVASINNTLYDPNRAGMFRTMYEQSLGLSAQTTFAMDSDGVPRQQTNRRSDQP
jgi:hypothetical protein